MSASIEAVLKVQASCKQTKKSPKPRPGGEHCSDGRESERLLKRRDEKMSTIVCHATYPDCPLRRLQNDEIIVGRR
jgi:hypothetical protein